MLPIRLALLRESINTVNGNKKGHSSRWPFQSRIRYDEPFLNHRSNKTQARITAQNFI